MKKRLSNVAFTEGSNLVVSNTTMRPFEKDSLAEILAKQIVKPTHFGECVQYLIDNKNIDTVLEIGPGKTLSKFTKQIDKSIKRYHISKLSDFKKFIDSVKESE